MSLQPWNGAIVLLQTAATLLLASFLIPANQLDIVDLVLHTAGRRADEVAP